MSCYYWFFVLSYIKKGVDTIINISTINLFLKDAFKNLRRNYIISISCIAILTATLFILGIFILIILNLRIGIIDANSKFKINVLLKDNIKISDQQNLFNRIKATNDVTYIMLVNNTSSLPSSILVEVNKPSDMPNIISRINKLQGVHEIKYSKNTPNRILIISKIIKYIGIVLFLILIVTSLFLVENIIKLSIYPRHNEINIMHCLGATDWFIRWSFIFEGIIIGFCGAVFSIVGIYLLYSFIYNQFNTTLSAVSINFIHPCFIFTSLSWTFILIGTLIAALGNIFVIRKFL